MLLTIAGFRRVVSKASSALWSLSVSMVICVHELTTNGQEEKWENVLSLLHALPWCCGFVLLFWSWLPFLSDIRLAQQVLHRVFPVARGVFEVRCLPSNDWVSHCSNGWCTAYFNERWHRCVAKGLGASVIMQSLLHFLFLANSGQGGQCVVFAVRYHQTQERGSRQNGCCKVRPLVCALDSYACFSYGWMKRKEEIMEKEWFNDHLNILSQKECFCGELWGNIFKLTWAHWKPMSPGWSPWFPLLLTAFFSISLFLSQSRHNGTDDFTVVDWPNMATEPP